MKYAQEKKIKDEVKETVQIQKKKETPGSILGNNHVLKQFKAKGQERFLIVKKKDPVLVEMEDIFQEWSKNNLNDIDEQRKLAAIAAKNSRKRKLSNRAARKELLRELSKKQPKAAENGQFSYADIVKKNLKPSMEDIFEAWKDYLQELDDILNEPSRTSFCKGESAEEILKAAKVYQKELQQCGQPTVKSATKSVKIEPEMIFASWRQNLMGEMQPPLKAKPDFEAENLFATWKHNLNDLKHQNHVQDEDYEVIFADWIENFESGEHANEVKFRSHEGKMLKNKQRQQRRSKKKTQF